MYPSVAAISLCAKTPVNTRPTIPATPSAKCGMVLVSLQVSPTKRKKRGRLTACVDIHGIIESEETLQSREQVGNDGCESTDEDGGSAMRVVSTEAPKRRQPLAEPKAVRGKAKGRELKKRTRSRRNLPQE